MFKKFNKKVTGTYKNILNAQNLHSVGIILNKTLRKRLNLRKYVFGKSCKELNWVKVLKNEKELQNVFHIPVKKQSLSKLFLIRNKKMFIRDLHISNYE